MRKSAQQVSHEILFLWRKETKGRRRGEKKALEQTIPLGIYFFPYQMLYFSFTIPTTVSFSASHFLSFQHTPCGRCWLVFNGNHIPFCFMKFNLYIWAQSWFLFCSDCTKLRAQNANKCSGDVEWENWISHFESFSVEGILKETCEFQLSWTQFVFYLRFHFLFGNAWEGAGRVCVDFSEQFYWKLGQVTFESVWRIVW
jgi:hypothetical protein